eukprot:scaffold7719_cov71-Cyclotella_meneghiniana.AAC.6
MSTWHQHPPGRRTAGKNGLCDLLAECSARLSWILAGGRCNRQPVRFERDGSPLIPSWSRGSVAELFGEEVAGVDNPRKEHGESSDDVLNGCPRQRTSTWHQQIIDNNQALIPIDGRR